MSNQLFITVKYGDNKEELFNPHCKSLLLLDCIREKCYCQDGIILDLVDEQGNVSNISEKDNLGEYANQFLEGRRTYVLIRITKSANIEMTPNKYESLLHNIEMVYPELSERLDRMSRPAQLSPKIGSKQGLSKRKSKAKSPKRSARH